MKLDHLLTLYTRINSKWIKDLNVSHRTIEIVEENIGSKILAISHRNMFADMSPMAREIKEKRNKWDSMKLQRSDSLNDSISLMSLYVKQTFLT